MSLTFAFGQIVATPAALRAAAALSNGHTVIATLLRRHGSGDWSEMDAHDQAANTRAVKTGEDRVFSRYTVEGVVFWVITEWDRSVTTVLLPSDY